MKSLIALSFILPVLVSCASTHPGHQGRSIAVTEKHLPLVLSARSVQGDAEDSFQLIEITAENVAGEWLKINRAEVVINSEVQDQLAVVTGQDLTDWAKAMDFQLRKDQHNKGLAMAGLVLAGTAVAAAGSSNGNSPAVAVGSAAVLGVYSWAIADAIANAKHAAEYPRQTPSDHLYTQFTVPGKMFVRKWLLIRKPVSRLVNNLIVEIESGQGNKDRFKIVL